MTEITDRPAPTGAESTGGAEEPERGPAYRAAESLSRSVQQNLPAILTALLLLLLVGAPLVYLVRMSLSLGRPADPGALSIANYQAVFGDGRTYSALGNTVLYSAGVTTVSLVLAATGAWLVERTDLPGRNIAWVAMLAPLAIPGVLASVAWILLLNQDIGILNVMIRGVLGFFGIELERGPLNIFSMAGMIFVEGVRGTTTLFLMIVGAFRLMDPAMEDAAALSGASRLKTIQKVTLPLLKPALLAALIYAFIGNLQDFDTPLLIGLPAGIFILPTLIYFVSYISPQPSFGMASAYAAIFVLLGAVLTTYYYRVVIKRARRFQTIVGKSFRPQRIALGRWKWPAVGLFVLIFVLALGLPLLVLLWTSLLSRYEPPTISALSNLTLENYSRLVGDPLMRRATWNSVLLGVSTATVGVLVGAAVSWAVVRARVRGAGVMDWLAFVPNAVPTVAFGLGIVVLYLSPAMRWTALYGSLLLLVMGLTANYLPFATRLSNGAMAQLSGELEEQAWVSGHGKLRTMTRITLPLLLPTLVAGWIWIFALSIRHLTLALLLGSRSTSLVAQQIYRHWDFEGDIVYTATIGFSLLVILVAFAFGARRILAKGFTGS